MARSRKSDGGQDRWVGGVPVREDGSVQRSQAQAGGTSPQHHRPEGNVPVPRWYAEQMADEWPLAAPLAHTVMALYDCIDRLWFGGWGVGGGGDVWAWRRNGVDEPMTDAEQAVMSRRE